MSLSKPAPLGGKKRSLVGAFLLFLRPAAASPSQVASASTAVTPTAEDRLQAARTQHFGSTRSALAAVPLPLPLGASAGTAVGSGLLVPGQLVQAASQGIQGRAGHGIWTWIVAGAGGAFHGVRQNRENRRRGGRRGVTAQRATDRQTVVELETSDVEGGWQTASEDEEDDMVPFPGQMQAQQAWPMMDQQGQYQQQFVQFNQYGQQGQMWPQEQQYNQQMQMQQMGQMQHLQPYMPMMQNGMVLVAVPVNQPQGREQQLQQLQEEQSQLEQLHRQLVQQEQQLQEASAAGPLQPGLQRKDSKTTGSLHLWADHAPSSASSEVSFEPTTPSTGRTASRWNSKESDMIVRQLKNVGTDMAQKKLLIARIVEEGWSMAVTKHGTRVVQAALEVADAAEKVALAGALKGRVWQSLKSPHANHVLQKVIALLPPKSVDFVIVEMKGRVADAARHPFGCRVVERLLEHCSERQTEALSAEILADVLELSRHPYGNYVVQHTLEHGTPEQRHAIFMAMLPELGRLARHKVSSHVVECALLHASQEDRFRLKEAMASNSEELASLTASNYGSFVVKEMKKR
mmetsp:Transcript_93393/g.166116  ORF Transcript_93393/g.166116 Transcript_93393/m.166116 type:complete len:574 (-) Transcript_93393:178-1899(-)|eukprot:CAMPEP_0197628616 /NCGR_PEP_ID=MMETSP1338-20131121/6844_1 /TAXON_ID=43686 ORGANISM="Pelagodinium beii, Strain RCC1491" /NCGR_SAMPLE_ID=MMETSP1338 /ASSEMBLY_ACC=CAM_ASM_000754 /LENGTH=573 /DNA_ID=CAMNT_0043199603 /DNA_START=52 /DNA_END=1773 /DNA_ORIENTATION=+